MLKFLKTLLLLSIDVPGVIREIAVYGDYDTFTTKFN